MTDVPLSGLKRAGSCDQYCSGRLDGSLRCRGRAPLFTVTSDLLKWVCGCASRKTALKQSGALRDSDCAIVLYAPGCFAFVVDEENVMIN